MKLLCLTHIAFNNTFCSNFHQPIAVAKDNLKKDSTPGPNHYKVRLFHVHSSYCQVREAYYTNKSILIQNSIIPACHKHTWDLCRKNLQ